MRSVRILAQVAAYMLFGASITYFAARPSYRHLPPETAIVRLSLSHAGQLLGQCRKLTETEKAALSPNMRVNELCPRERSPVRVRLEVDGRLLHESWLRPRGLARDGAAAIHREFAVRAGTLLVRVQVNDQPTLPGPGFEREERLMLPAGRVLTVDFDPKKGGVLFL